MGAFDILKRKLVNVLEEPINPATDEKIDALLTAVTTLTNAVNNPERVKKIAPEAAVFGSLEADEEEFSGWIDADGYSGAIVSIVAPEDSAVNGLIFENSNDGINVFHPHPHSVLANAPDGHHYPTTTECRYFGVRFINGPVAQTIKVHIALFSDMPEEGHVHPLEYPVDSDHSAGIGRAVILAKPPSGPHQNIGCTAGLNLKVALEEMEPEISEEIGLYPVGTGGNGSVTLTNADTSYAVPASAPGGSYNITLQNNSDSDIYIGYDDSAANGIKLEPGDSASNKLGAGQQLYAYCGTPGESLTYSIKLIN
jgi:hypothetical protein